MLGHIQRWHIFLVAILSPIVAPGLPAQTRAFHSDSLQLRYMRIRAQGTNACKVIVRTSGSMDIQTDISPANVRRWMDTATAYAAATPHRTKGQRVVYAWIPIRLGISRTITDRFDAFEFAIGGHGIPILAREIPRIAKLLQSAAAETLKDSVPCPDVPDV